jgi:hypothetical protein
MYSAFFLPTRITGHSSENHSGRTSVLCESTFHDRYCTHSQGMQHNPGSKTIEGELMHAMVKAGAVSEDNSDAFEKVRHPQSVLAQKKTSTAFSDSCASYRVCFVPLIGAFLRIPCGHR